MANLTNNRSTSIDVVLNLIGVLSIIAGAICAVVFAPSADVANKLLRSIMWENSVAFLITGTIGGVLCIAIGVLIRITDEMRAAFVAQPTSQQTVKQSPESEMPATAEAVGPDLTEIIENPDGTYSVMGRVYKSRETALAYLDRYGSQVR